MKQLFTPAASSMTSMMGVMVSAKPNLSPPFGETAFCRRLTLAGARHHLKVYVFTEEGILDSGPGIEGYQYIRGNWLSGSFPVPDIIYDRVSHRDPCQLQLTRQRLDRLTEDGRPLQYLARGLSGKWNVYQSLKRQESFLPHLPRTAKYSSSIQLARWLLQHNNEVFLKPHSGTHGKLTLHVRLVNEHQHLMLTGRDRNNVLFHKHFQDWETGAAWIDRFIGKRTFIIQPYLQLTSTDGRPFDVRVLMQKNESGRWSLTGMAVRLGEQDSVTSNLHGGGTAVQADRYLTREFGESASASILGTLRRLSADIPEYLESCFGRLAELGIDFGIDRESRVWIIEVNSKPGRSAFFQIGDQMSAFKSIENPILYARYLWLRQLRRVNS
ncbi:YheC/YheD family protein [Paenibacillus sp. YPG26]|uniref:YheC/YheD family endospore coat-associated protein n=1 Tax=Paenibacillus sp. YPG26 TaxID=2878915 RepID=UPI00203DE7C4|nr:YheC/YheD family protein [Paenibacillus sp. YPG26]USB32396.1 YheC/YheD family protein [Paenibacillus sp. YPG26]